MSTHRPVPVPAPAQIDDASTRHRSIHELFEEVCRDNADRVAYRFKHEGRWLDITWREARARVRRIARAMIALGIERGQTVAILSQTRLEWVLCDLAIANCGAATVGIYGSSPASECAYVLGHSEAELVFLEDAAQLEKLAALRGQLPRLRWAVVYDGPGNPAAGVMSWEGFLRAGDGVAEDQLDARGRRIAPGDLATIVYTSGTTGVPKGAMITHRNVLFVSWSAGESLHIEPDFVALLFLPLAHVFARLIVYTCVRKGNPLAFAESFAKVAENLREVRPHFIPSVPRVFEKVHEKATCAAREAGGARRRLFDWALGVGQRVSRLRQRSEPVPLGLRLAHRLADAFALRKVRGVFGGRLIYAISGAAPLNPAIAEFFHASGVLILEGIGMTENTSFSNVNRFHANKFGTVGPVGPGIEMKLAPDGEILFRGPNVMNGYFKDEAATAEAIDAEGWLHTGDVGTIDEDGFLTITDRKKDLIVTSGGKNVAPQKIERALRASPYIAQAVAVGDRRKFIAALVTLDPDRIGLWARERGIAHGDAEELARHPAVHELIGAEIERCNRELAPFESVKRFRILARDLSIEAGELTPTLKIRRRAVAERYAALIEEMYRG